MILLLPVTILNSSLNRTHIVATEETVCFHLTIPRIVSQYLSIEGRPLKGDDKQSTMMALCEAVLSAAQA